MANWLNTALAMEKKKLRKCPVVNDLVPGHIVAQGWGYVVAGYSLVEQSFKALLHQRGKQVQPIHPLRTLFDSFSLHDKQILREFHSDYRAVQHKETNWLFPFETLDDFLKNLDGTDRRTGSLDWRYFLIEKPQNAMPIVSAEFLHEITYGCIRMLEYANERKMGHPSQYTYSHRLHRKRYNKSSR